MKIRAQLLSLCFILIWNMILVDNSFAFNFDENIETNQFINENASLSGQACDHSNRNATIESPNNFDENPPKLKCCDCCDDSICGTSSNCASHTSSAIVLNKFQMILPTSSQNILSYTTKFRSIPKSPLIHKP